MANGRRSHSENRDTSLDGMLSRARFQKSLDILHTLGLSPQAIECIRRFAGITRKLPHEIVREVVEETAREWNTALPTRQGTRGPRA